MGTRERFERLSDHLEELYTERVRLYALRKTSGAPSSPSWENKSGGGMAGDRVGGAAVPYAGQPVSRGDPGAGGTDDVSAGKRKIRPPAPLFRQAHVGDGRGDRRSVGAGSTGDLPPRAGENGKDGGKIMKARVPVRTSPEEEAKFKRKSERNNDRF